MRVALGLEYDGSRYCGWQTQPNGNTVQDVLEGALGRIAGMPIRTVCAGRTDAGVHAVAQVVHFDAPVERSSTAWVRGVNAHLPPQVAVRWAVSVNDNFHARFSARSRSYCYLLLNRQQRPGVWAGKVGWHHRPIDLPAVQTAATTLIGEHDFSSFRSVECQAKSPIKRLEHCEVIRRDDLLIFEFRANAFLHHMIRNLVGALVYVGSGRLSLKGFADLLVARDRTLAPPTFMPDGLYFTGVGYDPAWGLPGQGGIIATPLLAIR